MTHTATFLPDADTEYVIFDSYDAETMIAEDPTLSEGAAAAEMMFSLGGHRGHYLAADYITEAASLFADDTRDARFVGWVAAADDYNDPDADSSEVSEAVHWSADEVESHLSDLGYVTEWNDGVSVWRIGETL